MTPYGAAWSFNVFCFETKIQAERSDHWAPTEARRLHCDLSTSRLQENTEVLQSFELQEISTRRPAVEAPLPELQHGASRTLIICLKYLDFPSDLTPWKKWKPLKKSKAHCSQLFTLQPLEPLALLLESPEPALHPLHPRPPAALPAPGGAPLAALAVLPGTVAFPTKTTQRRFEDRLARVHHAILLDSFQNL